MPHGLYIDKDENYWITDVAMQQVFKFSKSDRTKPQLTLGKKFEPGNGKQQFCKPSDVVVLRDSGDFFVSDGYCNKRIVRFSSKGEFKQQIPRQALIDSENSVLGEPGPLDLELPHALALDDDENMLFVADRLHSRIQVFSVMSEKFLSSINPGVFQPALYSMV